MTPREALRIFIFPTETTFIGALMIDYAFLYWALRPRRPEVLRQTIWALMIPVAALWFYLAPEMHKMGAMPLNWLFTGFIYFQMMLFGSYLGATVGPTRKYRFGWDIVATIFIFAVYVATRIALQRGLLPSIIYPVLFVFLAGMFYFLFQMAISYELGAIFKKVPPLAQLLTYIGVATLELYFVHERAKLFPWLQAIVFPLNIVALWALCLPIAVLVEKLVSEFRKRILQVT